MSNVFSAIAELPGWNMSVLLLLAKATIILVAALGITLSMQRASATARHLVWLVTLGMLLLVPALTAWAPLKVAILPAADVATRTPLALDNNTEIPAVPVTLEAPSAATQPATATAASSSAMDRLGNAISSMSAISLALTIWGAVVVAILATLAIAGFNVRRIVRRARPLTSPDWETPLYEIADRLGLEDAPRLLQSDDAKMPFACGMLKATIILPAESESWSLDRRRAVLLHELAHVRRHDLLGHTLGRLTCAVYWFHPLVWKAAKQLRSESERACDDLALACGTKATDYAEHLLDIVTSVRGENTPLVALAMARRKEFEGRMLAILDPDLRHSAPTRKQSAALIAALVLVSLSVGAVAPVARVANAAVPETADVTKTPLAPAAPSATPSPSPIAAPDSRMAVDMQQKAYPDSGVRGERSYEKVTSKAVSTATSVSQSTSTSRASWENGAAIGRITEAALSIGMSAAAEALTDYARGEKGEKGGKGSKSADERPALLAKILKSDTSASLRRIAAWGLQEYADQSVAHEALSSALRRDASVSVREMSAWALGQGDRGASDALTSALRSDTSAKVRATAAWALGNVGDRSSVDALTAALSDRSDGVRMRAAWAIGNSSPRQAPKQLVAMLNDSSASVRTLTAWALFNIADESTAPALDAALKREQNKDVQIAEIRALAALGERSVDALKSLLESSDPRVKQMAVRALAGGNGSGPWPWPWPDPRPFP